MARIRTIKPEFWQDEKLTPLPDVDRLLFLFLVSTADDCGRLLDKPIKIEADMFDGEQDRSRDIREALARLSRIGRIRRGKTASGQRIIEVVNWAKHQRVDHPNLRSAFPEIIEVIEDTEIREAFANDSRGIREALAHHTNDQRPVPATNDSRRGAARSRNAPRKSAAPKYPDFPIEDRQSLHAYWTEKVGVVDFPRLVAAIGPYWTADADHAAITKAVRDYCGIVTKGRSAPFASPADLAKKLGALIANAAANRLDPAARLDGVQTIVHGSRAA